MCEFCVWILGVDGRSRYLYNVLGRYLCILSALSVQSISASHRKFLCGRSATCVCVVFGPLELCLP